MWLSNMVLTLSNTWICQSWFQSSLGFYKFFIYFVINVASFRFDYQLEQSGFWRVWIVEIETFLQPSGLSIRATIISVDNLIFYLLPILFCKWFTCTNGTIVDVFLSMISWFKIGFFFCTIAPSTRGNTKFKVNGRDEKKIAIVFFSCFEGERGLQKNVFSILMRYYLFIACRWLETQRKVSSISKS